MLSRMFLCHYQYNCQAWFVSQHSSHILSLAFHSICLMLSCLWVSISVSIKKKKREKRYHFACCSLNSIRKLYPSTLSLGTILSSNIYHTTSLQVNKMRLSPNYGYMDRSCPFVCILTAFRNFQTRQKV